MVTERQFGSARLTLVQGDITEQGVDVIVNAANSSLLGGGGVDGAIHRVGGPEILAECRVIAARIGRLEAGGAVITRAGDLPAEYVVHAVGPVWRGGVEAEEATLERAYRESLARAREVGARSVAFPSISTGAYRFPVRRAARIALSTVASVLGGGAGLEEVRFVLFSSADLAAYAEVLASLS